jgi:hypothetical protein
MASLIVEGEAFKIDDLAGELDDRNYLSGLTFLVLNHNVASHIESVLSGFWKLYMHYLRESAEGLCCDWCQMDGPSWQEIQHTDDCPFKPLVELEK